MGKGQVDRDNRGQLRFSQIQGDARGEKWDREETMQGEKEVERTRGSKSH